MIEQQAKKLIVTTYINVTIYDHSIGPWTSPSLFFRRHQLHRLGFVWLNHICSTPSPSPNCTHVASSSRRTARPPRSLRCPCLESILELAGDLLHVSHPAGTGGLSSFGFHAPIVYKRNPISSPLIVLPQTVPGSWRMVKGFIMGRI